MRPHSFVHEFTAYGKLILELGKGKYTWFGYSEIIDDFMCWNVAKDT